MLIDAGLTLSALEVEVFARGADSQRNHPKKQAAHDGRGRQSQGEVGLDPEPFGGKSGVGDEDAGQHRSCHRDGWDMQVEVEDTMHSQSAQAGHAPGEERSAVALLDPQVGGTPFDMP